MNRKDILVLVLALVAASAAAAGGLRAFREGDEGGGGAAGGNTASFGPTVPFSSQIWRRCVQGHDPETEERNVRLRMLPSLLESYDLVGWPRSEVEAMLGPAAREVWTELFPHPGSPLGESASGAPQVLVIRYGNDDRVVGYSFPWGSRGRSCTER
jgi:hypothetical protein